MGMLYGTRRALLGGRELARIFKFDPSLITFTPGMAKRTSAGPFETAPIVQGAWTDPLQIDLLGFVRGTQISRFFYSNFDSYQGAVSLWITPEWDGDDGKNHYVYENSTFFINKRTTNELRFSLYGSGAVDVDVSGWTAGTTYHVVCRWDTKNTLDGTNRASISIDNVHTFGSTGTPTLENLSNHYIGTQGSNIRRPVNAIIEGLTIYRRPLFDGTYGVAANWDDSGPIDEVEEIYAAGAGQDPCLITGSWDIVFCLPTDSTAGALVTGTGEAWSHPHSSGVLEHQWLEDGGYLGRPWAVVLNGTSTIIDCGSGATLDDICAAGADITVEAWIRYDENDSSSVIMCKAHSAGTAGWALYVHNSNVARFVVNLATTDANVSGTTLLNDGKLHHVVGYYDDTTKTAYISVDGVWENSDIGVGAYQSDAALTLYFSRWGNINTGHFEGLFGWAAISNNDRYSHGTDFIPPRQPPATDGNHIEMWHIDEGTGALINAEVTSPANDGTLSNGTWEEQWDIETSPIVPYSVEFDGSATSINCGSAAAIDDIPAGGGEITVESWVRFDSDGYNVGIISKSSPNTAGWLLFKTSSNNLTFRVCGAVDWRQSVISLPADEKWHHVVGYYDDVAKTCIIGLDGIWQTISGAITAYGSDASDDLFIGDVGLSNYELDGAIGFARVSDNDRYNAGTNNVFTPPSRLNPPGVDGNTVAQWNFRDGSGTVLLDETANNNDGTITFGDGQWHITPDMEIDSPGERIFNWGYVIGNDAVDEGITQILSGLDAGENYVVRAIAHVESASRGRPKIIIYDETNGAQITALEGPSFTGNHDGLANAADLTDTTARFPQMLVGWTLYNITDGSSTTITAISGDMQVITGALSGGTDDDWDISDEYRIVPPGGPSEYDDYPWIETFTFELPTIARNGVAADCVSISLKLVNGVNNGVIKWHQVELLENSIDNPSMETPGAGANPWIPDGYINVNLDPGDSDKEVTIVHSGTGSMEWNPSAVDAERIKPRVSQTNERFYAYGGWSYGDGGAGHYWFITNGANQALHTHVSNGNVNTPHSLNWLETREVFRAKVSNANIDTPAITSDGGAVGDRFTDDFYCFELDDVSLTVTPASEANSEENGGLRVDGQDFCSQPIPAGDFTATSGWAKWKIIPRHSIANSGAFGYPNPYIAYLRFNATNYILLHYRTSNRLRLQFNDGGGIHQADSLVGVPTLDSATEYLFEIKYNASEMILKVDGATIITIATPINFANILNLAHWGTNITGGNFESDLVFKAP